MKLSEYKNEDALDLLADLLEPVSIIFSDKELANIVKGNGTKIEAIRFAIKNYKAEIITILARLEDTPKDKYEANLPKMINSLMELVNDKELVGFFTSQGQQMDATSSGSVTENIKERKK